MVPFAGLLPVWCWMRELVCSLLTVAGRAACLVAQLMPAGLYGGLMAVCTSLGFLVVARGALKADPEALNMSDAALAE